MKSSIWYVGGKSAGHIIPLITLAGKESKPAVFITTHRDLDKKLIDAAAVHQFSPQGCHPELVSGSHPNHLALYLPDVQRKKIWLYPWYMLTWFWASMRLFYWYGRTRPEKVVSTGGLTAVPVFLVARLMRVPCELFELNALPGDAVRLLAPFSDTVFYCYKTALQHLPTRRLQYKPYPVRDFMQVTPYHARIQLGLDPHRKTICFLGGSQGSHFINELALRIIAGLNPERFQILHQAGAIDFVSLAAEYAEKGYKAYVVDFYQEIELFYHAADFVICRAGAGTLWELEYMQVPTCIIPLKTKATDHQVYNAQALCAQKPQQFKLCLQDDAERSIERILEMINHLLL